MLRRLRRVGGVLLVLGLLAWGALLTWGNSVGARKTLLGVLRSRWPGAVELAELRMAWDLDVTLVGLKVADRLGNPFLDIPVVETGWRFPFGDRTPFWVRVPGGRIEIQGPSWGLAMAPQPPRLPYLAPQVPGLPQGALASAGTWKVPPEPLAVLELLDLEGVFAIPYAGIELPFEIPKIFARAHTGGRLEVHDAELRLADAAVLRAHGKLAPRHAELAVSLPETSVADLAGLPPLPMILVPFGLAPRGVVQGEVVLGTAMGKIRKAEGRVRFRELSVKMGPEEMLRDGAGSWTFRRDGGGVAGKLVLDDLAFHMSGLPIRLQKSKGRLEVAPRLVRLARMEGTGPLGPVRGSYRLDLRQGFSWNLDMEVGGAPGGWLSGATVLAGPAGIRLEGVSLRGKGLDVILETGVLSEGLDPPTWRLQEAGVFGTVPDGPLQLRDLGGVLYLDSEGGHSFFLESDQGKFQGQVTGDGGLKLWVKRSLGAEMKYLEFPAKGS